jgi:hypothetical protein
VKYEVDITKNDIDDIEGLISDEFLKLLYEYIMFENYIPDRIENYNFYYIINTEEKLKEIFKDIDFLTYLFSTDLYAISTDDKIEIYNEFKDDNGFIKYLIIKVCNPDSLLLIDFNKYFSDSDFYKELKRKMKKKIMESKLKYKL